MQYTNYKLVDEQIATTEIDGYKLNYVDINGIIYRGDEHKMTLLRVKPAYYGVFSSAILYTEPGWYLKEYKTRRTLRLLSLKPTTDNIMNIRRFFLDYLPKDNAHCITYILLQVSYGLVESLANLDMCGLDVSFITAYMRDIYGIDQVDIDKFVQIINYRDENIIPTRVSIRSIDKRLMSNLKTLLAPFKFDGIWYSRVVQPGENELCRVVNRELYKIETVKLTCVPSEINIFDPRQSLKLVKMEKISMKGGYRAMYNLYKSRYLELKNSIK